MAKMEKIEDRRPTWNSMSTLKVMERMETLYETSKWHDCVFKLLKSDGNGEELIFAHRIILASSSPVFEALCFGPMAEKSPISVPDVDPFAFRLMIKFIYTDTIEFDSVETACNVLYAAKKYLIYTLVGMSISYISYDINESNCLQIHEFAKFVHEERLIKESWSYLCSHLDDVLKYFSEESLTLEIIKNLVNEEALNGGEIVVFKICQLWAELECRQRNLEVKGENLRKILMDFDVWNKIRWFTLSKEELEDGPCESGILKNDEVFFIKKILGLLSELKEGSVGPVHVTVKNGFHNVNLDNNYFQTIGSALPIIQNRLGFCNKFPFSICNIIEPRRKIPLKTVYCHRFIERETRPAVGFQNDLKICTLVTANKLIRLTGIFLNGKILPIPQLNTVCNHTYLIERDYQECLYVTIFNSSNEKLFFTKYCGTVRYGTLFKISFDTPIILERLQEYQIQVHLLNSVENYLFGVRNSVSKFPSGLCVTFKEQGLVTGDGRLIEANDSSIMSGLELCL